MVWGLHRSLPVLLQGWCADDGSPKQRAGSSVATRLARGPKSDGQIGVGQAPNMIRGVDIWCRWIELQLHFVDLAKP